MIARADFFSVQTPAGYFRTGVCRVEYAHVGFDCSRVLRGRKMGEEFIILDTNVSQDISDSGARVLLFGLLDFSIDSI